MSLSSMWVGITTHKMSQQREQLPQISVPMLRLYGRLDGLVPIKVAKDLGAALPHTEQYIFTQSSHAPFMTEANAFCSELISFAQK